MTGNKTKLTPRAERNYHRYVVRSNMGDNNGNQHNIGNNNPVNNGGNIVAAPENNGIFGNIIAGGLGLFGLSYMMNKNSATTAPDTQTVSFNQPGSQGVYQDDLYHKGDCPAQYECPAQYDNLSAHQRMIAPPPQMNVYDKPGMFNQDDLYYTGDCPVPVYVQSDNTIAPQLMIGPAAHGTYGIHSEYSDTCSSNTLFNNNTCAKPGVDLGAAAGNVALGFVVGTLGYKGYQAARFYISGPTEEELLKHTKITKAQYATIADDVAAKKFIWATADKKDNKICKKSLKLIRKMDSDEFEHFAKNAVAQNEFTALCDDSRVNYINSLDFYPEKQAQLEVAKKEAERLKAEETARRLADAETVRRQAEEARDAARRQADEAALRQTEAETARGQAEKDKDAARRQAEEAARLQAKAETARGQAEKDKDTARRQAEEAARLQAEEVARRQTEADARKAEIAELRAQIADYERQNNENLSQLEREKRNTSIADQKGRVQHLLDQQLYMDASNERNRFERALALEKAARLAAEAAAAEANRLKDLHNNEEAQTLARERERLTEQSRTLQRIADELAAKRTALDAKQSALEAKERDLTQGGAALEAALNALAQEKDALRIQREAFDAQNADYLARCAELRRQTEALRAETAEIATQRQAILGLRAALEQERAEFDRTHDEFEEQTAEMQAQRTAFEREAAERSRRLTEQEAAFNARCASYNQGLITFNEQRDALRSQMAAFRVEKGNFERESAQTRQRLEAQAAQLETLRQALATQTAELQAQRTAFATEKAQQESALEQAQQTLATQQAQLRAAQQALTTQQAELRAAQQALTTQQAEFRTAQQALALQQTQLQAAQQVMATQQMQAPQQAMGAQQPQQQVQQPAQVVPAAPKLNAWERFRKVYDETGGNKVRAIQELDAALEHASSRQELTSACLNSGIKTSLFQREILSRQVR